MIVVVVERKGRGGSRWGQQETLARQLAEGVAQRWKAAQSTEDEARDSAGTSVAEEMVEKLWRVQEARRIGERNADDGGEKTERKTLLLHPLAERPASASSRRFRFRQTEGETPWRFRNSRQKLNCVA